MEPDSIIDSQHFTEIQIPLSRAVTLDCLDQAKHYNQICFHNSKLLGTGTTGKVYRGTYKFQPVAVKKYAIEGYLCTEVYTLAQLQHPYIVKSFAYSVEEHCLVTELMPKGSLGDVLDNETLDWKTTIKIASQVASALDYLHSVKNYVHGDVKSNNVLLDDDYNAKLADFDTTGIEQTRILTGTIGWKAPEILESIDKARSTSKISPCGIIGSENTKMADIFSFGIFLIELALGGKRFYEDYLIVVAEVYMDKSFAEQHLTPLEKIIADLKKENHFPLTFLELAEACLQKDPHKRPTSQQILSTLVSFPELDGQVKLKNKDRNPKVRATDLEREKYDITEKIRLQYAMAAEMGDTKKLSELFEAGFDPNLADFHGVTALMIAAHKGHVDAVSFLINISNGCSSLETISGWTALRSAVKNGDIKIINLLLDDGSDPNHLFFDDTTPLMLAARNGHTEVIKLLINRGAKTNYAHPQDWTALHSAVFHNQTKSTLTLCELGACLNPKLSENMMSSPLSTATANGNIEIVRILLNHGAAIAPLDHPYGATALHFAAQLGHIDIVNLFLEKNTHLIDKPLIAAIQVLMEFAEKKGFKKELSALLTHEGKINLPDTLPGFTALHLAAFFDHPDVVDVLLKSGAKITDTPSGISVIQLAEIMNNTQVVHRLNQAFIATEEVCEEQRYNIGFFALKQSPVDEKHHVITHGDRQELVIN